MKILIVEDEVIPATYLKKIFEKENYFVLNIVKRGQEAISIAKSEKPDVIFMDIMLQDNISGADAALEIHRSYPNIIIIFLTAFSDKEMIDFAVRSEAFAYLLKPYRDNEILATLELAKSKLNFKNKDIENKSVNILKLVAGYSYNFELRRIFFQEKEVLLGPKALQLIQLLCDNRMITLEMDEIMGMLWNESKPRQTLRSLIHRVRQITTSELIQNVNKFGYKIGVE